jgi:hypothetical protein
MLAKENWNASSKLSFLLKLYLVYVLYTQKKIDLSCWTATSPVIMYIQSESRPPTAVSKLEVAIMSTQSLPPFTSFGEGGQLPLPQQQHELMLDYEMRCVQCPLRFTFSLSVTLQVQCICRQAMWWAKIRPALALRPSFVTSNFHHNKRRMIYTSSILV